MAHGQILYALVARETNVLAEHQTPGVPFDLPTATRLVLQRIPMEDKRHTYEFDQEYLFVCLVSEGICYLCLCQKSAELRRVFGYLEDIKKQFMQRFAAEAYAAHTLALNASFAPILEQRLDYFNTDPEAMFQVDKLGQVQRKTHDNISQMQSNLDLVLERGEVLDHLVEKTEALDSSAFKFERSSKKVKNAMFWKKIKTYVCLTATLVLVIYVAMAFFCGGLGLDKCVSHSSSSSSSGSSDDGASKISTWAPTFMPVPKPTTAPIPSPSSLPVFKPTPGPIVTPI